MGWTGGSCDISSKSSNGRGSVRGAHIGFEFNANIGRSMLLIRCIKKACEFNACAVFGVGPISNWSKRGCDIAKGVSDVVAEGAFVIAGVEVIAKGIHRLLARGTGGREAGDGQAELALEHNSENIIGNSIVSKLTTVDVEWFRCESSKDRWEGNAKFWWGSVLKVLHEGG